MTDLHRLLHEAAPEPSRPLDLLELRQRAARSAMRRTLAWVTGLGVAVASLPVGNALVLHAGDGSAPALDPAPQLTVPVGVDEVGEQATEGVATTVATTSSPDESAAPPAVAGHPTDATVPPPPTPSVTAPGQVTGTTTRPADRPTHPARASCAVDTDGMTAGQQRSCYFTATAAGGAAMSGDLARNWEPRAVGEITVRRRGEIVYEWDSESDGFGVFAGEAGVHSGTCGEPSADEDRRLFIQPGDAVDVVLRLEREPEDTITLGAGEGWSCDGPRHAL